MFSSFFVSAVKNRGFDILCQAFIYKSATSSDISSRLFFFTWEDHYGYTHSHTYIVSLALTGVILSVKI